MAKILRLWERSGGASRLEHLLRPHLPPLYRLAYRLTGSEPDAEDLLQDLVLRLHGRADEIGGLDRPDLWLSRVLYRLFVDEHRRSRLRPRPASADPEEGEPAMEREAAPDPGPERSAERLFESRRLQRALDTLPEEQRTVVLLHEVEGYRLTELTGLLDVPIGTLKSRLHRARRRLRDLLVEGTS